jgi:hypothetical protein
MTLLVIELKRISPALVDSYGSNRRGAFNIMIRISIKIE